MRSTPGLPVQFPPILVDIDPAFIIKKLFIVFPSHTLRLNKTLTQNGSDYNLSANFKCKYILRAPGRFFDGHIFDGHIFDGHIFDGHIIDGHIIDQ